ncbi:MAG: hypothetical protein ACKOSS_01610 [Planctomycetia bacterium]
MTPAAADLVRKVLAGALSITVTVLLFRVMFRAAQGRASAGDPELWVALVLLALGFWWVKSARRVRGLVGLEPPPGERDVQAGEAGDAHEGTR